MSTQIAGQDSSGTGADEGDRSLHLSGITVAPIATTIRGLATEVLVGPRNNLDHDCVVHWRQHPDDPAGAPAGTHRVVSARPG
jgi:hypothetical protein